MSIIRVKKDDKYFSASNEPFNDKRLSWESRGLMGYLLSKPNNWQVRMADLEKQGEAGNFKLRRMLAELRNCGYMNRIRVTKEGGLFDWITEVYESPSQNPKPSKEVIKITSGGKSTSGLSTSGKPPDIVITDEASTEVFNNEPPTDDEAEQMKYELIALQFSKATLPYFEEFYRLTKMLPEGKKQLKDWKEKCSTLYGAKVLISDMETALNMQLDNNYSVKDPGSLMTNMQTIKLRREKGVVTKPPKAQKTNEPKAFEGIRKFLAIHQEQEEVINV
jgi:hypothetical protein